MLYFFAAIGFFCSVMMMLGYVCCVLVAREERRMAESREELWRLRDERLEWREKERRDGERAREAPAEEDREGAGAGELGRAGL